MQSQRLKIDLLFFYVFYRDNVADLRFPPAPFCLIREWLISWICPFQTPPPTACVDGSVSTRPYAARPLPDESRRGALLAIVSRSFYKLLCPQN